MWAPNPFHINVLEAQASRAVSCPGPSWLRRTQDGRETARNLLSVEGCGGKEDEIIPGLCL